MWVKCVLDQSVRDKPARCWAMVLHEESTCRWR